MNKLLIATLISTATAYCPNGCSGHGTCKTNPKVSLTTQYNETLLFESGHQRPFYKKG